MGSSPSTTPEDITKAETPFDILKELDPVPEHRFFVVTEWMDRWVEATRLLGGWVQKVASSTGKALAKDWKMRLNISAACCVVKTSVSS